jgi:hypothetical protein
LPGLVYTRLKTTQKPLHNTHTHTHTYIHIYIYIYIFCCCCALPLRYILRVNEVYTGNQAYIPLCI